VAVGIMAPTEITFTLGNPDSQPVRAASWSWARGRSRCQRSWTRVPRRMAGTFASCATAWPASDEQSHGIEVEGGTEDLLIDRCILRDCFGDGVRLLGRDAAGKNVKRVRITNCLFQANKRSGLGIQRALEQIVVSHCMFDATVSDQDIDFEPTGSDAPTDLLIQGCIINHTTASVAVSLSGIGGASPLLRCKFTDNIVLGGQVFCTDVDQLTVQNNMVAVPDVGNKNRIPLQVQRGGESLLITGNLLVNDCAATEAVISLSEVNQRQVSRALVAGNMCLTRAGRGIQCLSSDDVAIQGNMVVATGLARRASSCGLNRPAWTASRCVTTM
jgi:Right handed beta helix region